MGKIVQIEQKSENGARIEQNEAKKGKFIGKTAQFRLFTQVYGSNPQHTQTSPFLDGRPLLQYSTVQ